MDSDRKLVTMGLTADRNTMGLAPVSLETGGKEHVADTEIVLRTDLSPHFVSGNLAPVFWRAHWNIWSVCRGDRRVSSLLLWFAASLRVDFCGETERHTVRQSYTVSISTNLSITDLILTCSTSHCNRLLVISIVIHLQPNFWSVSGELSHRQQLCLSVHSLLCSI